MEPETARTQTQTAADLRASEVEVLRSRVVGIVGGVGRRARRSLEDPDKELQEEEEEDEGDDSVFYDDGCLAPRPVEEEEEEEEGARPRLCDARERREEMLDESEGGAGGPEPGEMDAVASATRMESPQGTRQDTTKRPPGERQGARRTLAPGDSKDPGGGFTEDKHAPKARPELRTSIPKGDVTDEEEEEEVVANRQQPRAEHAAEPGPGGVWEGRRAPAATAIAAIAAIPEPAGGENLAQQMSSDELQIPGANREEPDQLDHNSQSSTGRPQESSHGFSTLPLPKKLSRSVSAKQAASDPEASAPRYNTLSYRKIQRGNTRQKIKEFEFKGMKL